MGYINLRRDLYIVRAEARQVFNIAGVSHKTGVEKSRKPKHLDSLECTAAKS